MGSVRREVDRIYDKVSVVIHIIVVFFGLCFNVVIPFVLLMSKLFFFRGRVTFHFEIFGKHLEDLLR